MYADENSRARRRLELEKGFFDPSSSPEAGVAGYFEPIATTEEERVGKKATFLSTLRDFQVGYRSSCSVRELTFVVIT